MELEWLRVEVLCETRVVRPKKRTPGRLGLRSKPIVAYVTCKCYLITPSGSPLTRCSLAAQRVTFSLVTVGRSLAGGIQSGIYRCGRVAVSMDSSVMLETTIGGTLQAKAVTPERVSVVVIGRNESGHLRACLESVRSMLYPPELVELIYVDSESGDSSREIAAEMGAIVIPLTGEPRTAARGRNAGWLAAKWSAGSLPRWRHRTVSELCCSRGR